MCAVYKIENAEKIGRKKLNGIWSDKLDREKRRRVLWKREKREKRKKEGEGEKEVTMNDSTIKKEHCVIFSVLGKK